MVENLPHMTRMIFDPEFFHNQIHYRRSLFRRQKTARNSREDPQELRRTADSGRIKPMWCPDSRIKVDQTLSTSRPYDEIERNPGNVAPTSWRSFGARKRHTRVFAWKGSNWSNYVRARSVAILCERIIGVVNQI